MRQLAILGGLGELRALRTLRHPVRLPFGPGSMIVGSKDPLEVQLDTFLSFLSSDNWKDYERAKKLAVAKGPVPAKWSRSHRKRILSWLGKEELGRAKSAPLKGDDPWVKVIPQLPKWLCVVATNGIPSLGTRTRWTTALVQELVDLVPRQEVEGLMRYWHQNRNHISEDIDVQPRIALEQTLDIIDERYRQLHGLPRSVWETIRKSVLSILSTACKARREPASLHAAQGRRYHVRHLSKYKRIDLERTAFLVARRFFDEGSRVREVWGDELEEFTGSNASRGVRVILTAGTWLFVHGPHVKGVHSTEFALAESLWPAAPGEPVLYCPP